MCVIIVCVLTDQLRIQQLDILGCADAGACHITDARLCLESVSRCHVI